MKSEHRHELQTNELEKLTSKGQDFFEQHGNTVLIVLCVIMLVSAGVIYRVRSSQVVATHGWGQLVQANSPVELETIGQRWPDSPAGRYAKLREAESLLESGIQQSFSHREAAESDLKKAKEIFAALIQSESIPQPIDERAKFGLASAIEATSDTDVTDAIKAYEGLVNKYPNTIFKSICESRIENLKARSSQEFYAWFQQQNPSPQDRDTVQDTPFVPPEFPQQPPEPVIAPKPDPLESPNFPAADKTAEAGAQQDAAGSDQPATSGDTETGDAETPDKKPPQK